MAFKKGQGGRPKGAPNKNTHDVRVMCQQMVADPAYQKSFWERWREGRLPAPLEAMVWAYGHGKPKEYVEHSGEVQMMPKVVFELRNKP